MKILKNSNDISQEEFDKMMNPDPTIEQARMMILKDRFMKKMIERTKEAINIVYGKDAPEITPNIESQLRHVGDIVYIEYKS